MEENLVPLEVVTTDSLAAIERVQVDVQVSTAKKYPRNIAAVKSAMLGIATLDEETAASCFYSLPRGGKSIQGPSVRLAEIALSSYGNVKAATRILTVETGANPHCVVQAVVHDMERNVCYAVEKRRRIVGKKSKGGKPDEDDISLAVNAGSAIAFRDAVFKVVPGALVKSVYEAAKKVAVGDVKSLVSQRQKVFERFKQMGVSEDRVLQSLDLKKVDEVTLEHLEHLIGVGTSLRDGQTTIEEAFPIKSQSESKPIFEKPEVTPKIDENDDAPMDFPIPAATAEAVNATTEQAKQTPQAEVAYIVTSNGFSFDNFQRFAVPLGLCEQAATSFDDISDAAAKRCLKAQAGMLRAMKGTVK